MCSSLMMHQLKRWLMVLCVLTLAGCPRGEQLTPSTTRNSGPDAPRASVALRVIVVNDPEVAEAINRLRGEWAERSGGELTATAKTWAQIATAKNLDADVIIFPSRYLGTLCARDWLRPLRAGVIESNHIDADGIYPLIRRTLIKWGGETMALPLGIDPHLTTKPSDAHPAIDLLVQAAPAITAAQHDGIFFNPQTMKPRIADSEFVDALQHLVDAQAAKGAPSPEATGSVPILGLNDRLVAATSNSRNGASAFKLIAWLFSPDISAQLAKVGEQLTSPRKPLASAQNSSDAPGSEPNHQSLAERTAAALNSDQSVVLPAIPGMDDYLAALDSAVKAAVDGKLSPQAALENAAKRWDQITDELGRDTQRQAYLKHLGITEQ
jgi:hypothetical protein